MYQMDFQLFPNIHYLHVGVDYESFRIYLREHHREILTKYDLVNVLLDVVRPVFD